MIRPEIYTSMEDGVVVFKMSVNIDSIFKSPENVELFRQMHKTGMPSQCLVPMKKMLENIERDNQQ